MPQNYLPQVKSQYESLPYPPCNPEDDRKRLVMTWLEDLPMSNHDCFAGKQSFTHHFRALVAGGYAGPVSSEAFSPRVHALADPGAALRASMEFIRAGVSA